MRMPPLPLAAAAIAAVTVLFIDLRHRKSHEEELNGDSKRSRRRLSKHSTAAGEDSQDSPAIPPAEAARLHAFLEKVCGWRGWPSGKISAAAAWHEAHESASTPPGGSWLPDFKASALTDAACDGLLHVIDATFFGGVLLQQLQARNTNAQEQQRAAPNASMAKDCSSSSSSSSGGGGGGCSSSRNYRHGARHRQPLCCRVVRPAERNDDGWLALFLPSDNAVYINGPRWAVKHVSSTNPVNCEGVLCENRLSVLLHTLAHELVHAIVYHLFPDIDASCPAYLAHQRHGPVFALLNKSLFGHSSDAMARAGSLLRAQQRR
jgi:hypothetical protein